VNVLFKMAVISGVESVVRLHITRGEDVNAQDSAGMSPLMIASAKGHGSICRILLEAGANPLLHNKEGEDALTLSRLHKRPESQEVLQEYLGQLPRKEPLADPFSTVKEFAEEPGMDISMWEEEVDSLPPPEDHTCLADAEESHRRLSAHIPIDRYEDWSDVDIELPDMWIGTTCEDPLNKSTWVALRQLFMFGLQNGRVFWRQIFSLIDADTGLDPEYIQRLLLVLGDMEILVDEWVFTPGELEAFETEGEDHEENGYLADEAVDFFKILSFSPSSRKTISRKQHLIMISNFMKATL
jgi:RNA polymerase primary sigma factor